MLFRRLSPLIATVVVVLIGCGGDDDSSSGSEFQIIGSWRGELHQQGLEPFEVSAQIRNLDQPSQNTVHYTGIDCGGNWEYIGKTGAVYRFREVINRGAGGSCKGVGIVLLRPQGANSLAYQFTGGGVESVGALTRSG